MDWSEYQNKLDEYKAGLENRSLIEKAFFFAEKSHEGQKRYSGENYIEHPIKVSLSIAAMGLDANTISAALLHDTIEDQKTTSRDIKKHFGADVAFLVNGVTKVDKIKYHGVQRQAESMRKMFLAIAEDIRVVVLKLMDRLHNMETLSSLPYPEKRIRIAKETLEIYAPIADRLGIWDIKAKLEDLAFSYVYPEEYKWMQQEVKKRVPMREYYIERIIPIVKKELGQENLRPLEVNARAKHYYSLWKKLLRYDMDWDLIYDLVAVRIIVSNIQDAYGALGIIHKNWKPLPGRIKDFIALPKPNGYQSIHTTVFCIDGKVVEFQIRTAEMHHEAEIGIAAHWAWAEAGKPKRAEGFKGSRFIWVTQLREWQKKFTKKNMDSAEFLEALKIDFFKDRIFVLTPKGDVIDLPEDATPLDFAYHIHSEIGNHAVGAKVNGKMVPFNHKLQSEDVVEILTKKDRKPSQEWLEIAKTSVAKSHIKSLLRKKEKQFSIQSKKLKSVELIVTCKNRVGILKDISNALSSLKINIEDIESHAAGKNYPSITLSFTPVDQSQIEKVKTRIKKVHGVYSIELKRFK